MPPRTWPRTVLVVDDEPIIRAFLAEGLADAGYVVVTARDGAEALERVRQHNPDAVLLDLLMPVMDGWAFLRERRVAPQLASVPVVVFSAAGREGLSNAVALRATAALSKPLDLDVLSAVLDHVLKVEGKSVDDSSDATSGPMAEVASPRRRVGNCPVCGIALFADIDDGLSAPARIRVIHATRRAHILSHSAGDNALLPLWTTLLQLQVGRRPISANCSCDELRQEWGSEDLQGVHSIDEALGSASMHRLWQDASCCSFEGCPHRR